jgi:uncharacterized cupin superfamily protein
MGLLRFPLTELETASFETGSPDASRVLSGHPVFRTWTVDARDDDTLFSGVWESTPGKWRIVYDEWEFCSILSGRSIVTRDGEAPEVFGPGDSFIIEPGFTGTWEVVSTTRKLFVVRLPRAIAFG